MRALGLLILFVCSPSPSFSQATPPEPVNLSQVLERLSQEAEAFRLIAPTTLAEETLEQRARPSEPGAEFTTHEVVSEYGFARVPGALNAIHEVRKVVSVDGKRVVTLEKARHAMSLGLKSDDDKLKRRLLEDFEKHGLRGAATDFGQVILLFSARHLKDYEFQMRGERQIGADHLLVLSFVQKAGDSGMTVFVGNAAKREPLHGDISMRVRDLVPLRITVASSQTINSSTIREESTVDYKPYPAGAVLPVSVVHREYIQDLLQSENTFSYTSFRKLAPGVGMKLPGI